MEGWMDAMREERRKGEREWGEFNAEEAIHAFHLANEVF